MIFYHLTTISSQLLSYQAINSLLQDMTDRLEEEWSSKEKHDELVFFCHKNNTNIAQILETILRRYTADNNDAVIYAVTISDSKNKANLLDNDIVTLTKIAKDVIKYCERHKKDYKESTYDCLVKCWRVKQKHDYKRLEKNMEKSNFMYIVGFFPGHSSFKDNLQYLLPRVDECQTSSSHCIIHLKNSMQRHEKYLEIDYISNQLRVFKDFAAPLTLLEIHNSTQICDASYTEETKKIQPSASFFAKLFRKSSAVFCRLIFLRNHNYFPIKHNMNDSNGQAKNSIFTKVLSDYVYKGLVIDKIIRHEELVNNISEDTYRIHFTSMLLKSAKMVGNNYANEVVVLVTLEHRFHIKHLHMIKYPVSDPDGKHQITNYDANLDYYRENIQFHSQLIGLLNMIYDGFAMSLDLEEQETTVIQNVLEIDCFGFSCKKDWTYQICIYNPIKTYHEKNIGLIMLLERKYGDKILITLHDVDSLPNNMIAIEGSCWYQDLTQTLLLNNPVDLDDYKKGKVNNVTNVLIHIAIKDDVNGKSSYYLLQERYQQTIRSMEELGWNEQTQNDTYIHLMEAVDRPIDENLMTEMLFLVMEFDDALKNVFFSHLQRVARIIVNYANQDFKEFALLNPTFVKKVLLLARSELETIYAKALAHKTNVQSYSRTKKHKRKTRRKHGKLNKTVPNNLCSRILRHQDSETTKKMFFIDFLCNHNYSFYNFEVFVAALTVKCMDIPFAFFETAYLHVLNELHAKFVLEILYKNDRRAIRKRSIYLQCCQITNMIERDVEILEIINRLF